jgi:hypothetical protein
MKTLVWLVPTLRPVGGEVGRSVLFHRDMGLVRQILFFDDPNAPNDPCRKARKISPM